MHDRTAIGVFVNECPPALSGLKVLVIEDEFPILLLVEDMLAEFGCEIVRTASALAEAVKIAASCDVDLALLDINLGGAEVFPAAEILKRRNVPIVFSTGYGAAGIGAAWAGYPVLQKPYLASDLAEAVAKALQAIPISCLAAPNSGKRKAGAA